MQHVEFTIEPFVDGNPGPHVTQPQAALTDRGYELEIGPFGTGVDVEDESVGEVVALISELAVQHGATHVHLDVQARGE